LEYRHPDGRFAGSAVIEASALISARMTADVYGLNDRLVFASGFELDAETVRQVPESMIGRLLDEGDLHRLQQALMPKKPRRAPLGTLARLSIIGSLRLPATADLDRWRRRRIG
jgi:hypothetical protein